MTELDRLIHEPARLLIVTALSGVPTADFNFLLSMLGLTKGNLSFHMHQLERGGYVEVIKGFNGKVPHTAYRLTEKGRAALEQYWSALDQIRNLGRQARKSAPKLRIRMDLGDQTDQFP